jgi:hypothetical protein
MTTRTFSQLTNYLDSKVKKFAEDTAFTASVAKILERVVESASSGPEFAGVNGIATVSAEKNIEQVVSVYFQLVLDKERYNYIQGVGGAAEMTKSLIPRCQQALTQAFPGMEFKVQIGIVPEIG